MYIGEDYQLYIIERRLFRKRVGVEGSIIGAI